MAKQQYDLYYIPNMIYITLDAKEEVHGQIPNGPVQTVIAVMTELGHATDFIKLTNTAEWTQMPLQCHDLQKGDATSFLEDRSIFDSRDAGNVQKGLFPWQGSRNPQVLKVGCGNNVK